MSVKNNNVEDNNTTSSFPNIKIIALGVLLAALFIGGLGYYFASNKKPSEEPVKEVIEDNQETIENKEQEEVIINNGYIPVIDCLWLDILFFVIISVVIIIMDFCILCGGFQEAKEFKDYFLIFVRFLLIQVIFYLFWFILMLIFAGFSKIWDEEHSWWSNVKKGFLRNRIYFKGDYFWTFWLLAIVVNAVIGGLMTLSTINRKKKTMTDIMNIMNKPPIIIKAEGIT